MAHESRAKKLARERRDAAARARRAAARKRRDAARKIIREEARKRRDAKRRALRKLERQRRDALRRLARKLAREERDELKALLRKERRLLLRQKYVTRMVLAPNGQWQWYRMGGSTSTSQLSKMARGQKGYLPRVGGHRARQPKATKFQSSQSWWKSF
jgi:hypothetical protein